MKWFKIPNRWYIFVDGEKIYVNEGNKMLVFAGIGSHFCVFLLVRSPRPVCVLVVFFQWGCITVQ
jgi:hypothetical protein